MTAGTMRQPARIALVTLALLLLAAHFYRAGLYVLIAASVAAIGLLFVTRAWAGRLLQFALLAGTAEWLRIAWILAERRAATGQPYARLLLILGAVALVTLAAAFLAGRGARTARQPAPD